MKIKQHHDDSPKGKLIKRFAKYHINDNILHIHIPKCAGTWLKDVIYDTHSGYHRFNFSHRPANVIKQELAEKGYNYDDFYSFSVVRNPWERIFSSYLYSRYGSEVTTPESILNPKKSTPLFENPYIIREDAEFHDAGRLEVLENIKQGFVGNDFNVDNFSQYVDEVYNSFNKRGNLNKFIYLVPQYRYVTDENKNIIVNKIFKTTEIKELFDWIYSINKDSMIKLRAKLIPTKNISPIKVHYFNIYNDESIDKVSKIYKDDIELFNFTFEK